MGEMTRALESIQGQIAADYLLGGIWVDAPSTLTKTIYKTAEQALQKYWDGFI